MACCARPPLSAYSAATHKARAPPLLEEAAFVRAVQKEFALSSATAPQDQDRAAAPSTMPKSASCVAFGGMNPQDGGSASLSPKTAQKKTPAVTPFGRSPSTPALGNIRGGFRRSSSRLAFESPITRSSSSILLGAGRATGFAVDDDAEADDEDLWWGAGKRGVTNDPPANVATELLPAPVRQPTSAGGPADLETILLKLKQSSLSWTRCTETELRRRYHFDHSVGCGLTAEVHAGRAPDGTWVALKGYTHLGHLWRWPDQPDALDADEMRDPILRGVRHLLSEYACLSHLEANVASSSAGLDLKQSFVESLDVKVVEVVMTEKFTYLVQQFGGKLTLYDVMNSCRGNEPFARNVFKQLLLNVQVCHTSGVVHRDIKPENIIVSYKNEPWELNRRKGATRAQNRSASNFRDLMDLDKDTDADVSAPASAIGSAEWESEGFEGHFLPITRLVDFGLGCILTQDSETGDCSQLSGACGTPLFAAPEVLNSARNSPGSIEARPMDSKTSRSREVSGAEGALYDGKKADMYSLGVILYALLCGRLPFEAETISELRERVSVGDIDIPNYVSQDANELIRRLMHVDAAARLSAGDALTHKWMDGGSLPSTPVLKAAVPLHHNANDGFKLDSVPPSSVDYDDEDDDDDDGGGMWYC